MSPAARTDIPVEPDVDEARRLLQDELLKAEYREAQPTLFDELSARFFEWLMSLEFSGDGAIPDIVPIFSILLIGGLLLAAYLIFGRPSLNRRARTTDMLFGDAETRTADQLRRDAANHAASGRWDDAISDIFRALARGLTERTVVTMLPGTTAQDFATRAGHAFPQHRDDLGASANLFDGVRYLGRAGTRDGYEMIRALDTRVRAAKPVLARPELATVEAGTITGGERP